jgi:hypothetical protein
MSGGEEDERLVVAFVSEEGLGCNDELLGWWGGACHVLLSLLKKKKLMLGRNLFYCT